MTTAPASLTVFIPLTIRKCNGRPKIVLPLGVAMSSSEDASPHLLRAIARAWGWRRRLESGEASTMLDIALAEGVTDRYVSKLIKLAYLSPAALDKPLLQRSPPAVSIKDMIAAADLPWADQGRAVFGDGSGGDGALAPPRRRCAKLEHRAVNLQHSLLP
ncbi:MAG: hypothetical protein ABIM50_01835 [Novosphingobium sp.]